MAWVVAHIAKTFTNLLDTHQRIMFGNVVHTRLNQSEIDEDINLFYFSLQCSPKQDKTCVFGTGSWSLHARTHTQLSEELSHDLFRTNEHHSQFMQKVIARTTNNDTNTISTV